MNQTTNLIQYKNCTDEQKDGFDFEGYAYQVQGDDCYFYEVNNPTGLDGLVYRLKIEPEKWYYWHSLSVRLGGIVIGKEMVNIDKADTLRPAKPSEIPKPKRVFKDGAFYPVRCGPHIFTGEYNLTINRICGLKIDDPSIDAIGEELNINWGEE